jgi:uncharacterized protein
MDAQSPQNVMHSSPLDRAIAIPTQGLVQLTRTQPSEWIPSRYNARARDDDGRLVVWNTFTSNISAFEAHQAAAVEELLSQKGFSGPLTGIRKYLHERGFLVPKGAREQQKLQLAFGQQQYRTDTLQLILLASEDCNFRCVYCYEDFARGTMLPEVREGVRNLVAARAPRLQELRISWFGGEPLYGWEAIEDLAPFFAQVVRDHGLRYVTHMTTNAYLLTPEVAGKLLEWEIRDFQITVDGTAEDHDHKRVGRDGSGTFATILRNLQALRDRPDEFFVTIRVNFDRENYPNFDGFLELLHDEFAGDHRFNMRFSPVGRWGGPNDETLNTCGSKESWEVKSELQERARGLGLQVRGALQDITVGSQVCYAARPYNFIVGADGKLMKCTVALDKHDYNVVGRITPQGDLELDDDRMALWTQPAFQNDSGCGACHMSPTCQGMACPLVRIQRDERPCPDTKKHLHTELVGALRASAPRARQVVVRPEPVAAG